MTMQPISAVAKNSKTSDNCNTDEVHQNLVSVYFTRKGKTCP